MITIHPKSESTVNWRRRAKTRLVEAFGGGCGICGYNRCHRNLAFHHIDPKEKDKEFGAYHYKSWAKIVVEIRKCVMLCHNCHGEYHDGLIEDLSICPRFNEDYAIYTPEPSEYLSKIRANIALRSIVRCEVCDDPVKHHKARWCSIPCRAKGVSRFQGTRDELLLLFKSNTIKEISSMFEVTPQVVSRWRKKFNIPIESSKKIKDRRIGEVIVLLRTG